MLLSGRSIASWLGPVRRRCFSSSFLDTKTRLEYDTVIGIGGGVGPMAGVAADSKAPLEHGRGFF